jgi:hypothetical protein
MWWDPQKELSRAVKEEGRFWWRPKKDASSGFSGNTSKNSEMDSVRVFIFVFFLS